VPAVRRNAAVSLGRLGARSAVPALIEALGDEDAGVRRETAKALGFIKDQRAAPALVEALGDRSRNVRVYAAYALGEIKDPKTAPALLDALGDAAWCVRDQAAWALRELRDPQILEPLVAALRAEHADLPHVMWLLEHLEPERAIGALSGLLEDEDVEVRRRALEVLCAIGGKAIVEPLIAALGDRDPAIRLRAIEALVELRDKRARKPVQALAEKDKSQKVREAAAEAYALMSRHKALAAHWSFDDRNTKVAKDVLGRGIDGEIKGCKPVEGKVGHALQFAGGAYVELGKPAKLNIGQQPFTVAAWAKTNAKNGVVVARGGAFCGYSLYVKDGTPRFGIHRVQDGPAYIAAATDKLPDGWVHLAGVVKKNRIELYVNGTLAATAKTPGYIPGNCGQGMAIGFDTGNSPAEICDAFQGVIDEVKAFDAALSAEAIAEQISDALQAGKP
jgi:HEAT repeat protein